MRIAMVAVAVLAACGGGDGGRVTITTRFTVATLGGHGPSPFDVLQGHVIDVRVELDAPAVAHAMTAAGADVCRTTQLTDEDAVRTASG